MSLCAHPSAGIVRFHNEDGDVASRCACGWGWTRQRSSSGSDWCCDQCGDLLDEASLDGHVATHVRIQETARAATNVRNESWYLLHTSLLDGHLRFTHCTYCNHALQTEISKVTGLGCDCRASLLKLNRDPEIWEAIVLAHARQIRRASPVIRLGGA